MKNSTQFSLGSTEDWTGWVDIGGQESHPRFVRDIIRLDPPCDMEWGEGGEGVIEEEEQENWTHGRAVRPNQKGAGEGGRGRKRGGRWG